VERVIADAGKGRERGVKLAQEARKAEDEAHEEATASPRAMGLDVLHTQYEFQCVLHQKRGQAARGLEAAAKAATKVARTKKGGYDARGVTRQAWWAWRKAERLFDEAVQAAAAAQQIGTALAVLGPQGTLNARPGAQGQLDDAIRGLAGPEWSKVRRLLCDQRTLRPLDWVHAQLAQAVVEPRLREALVRLWYLNEAREDTPDHHRARLAQLALVEQVVCQRLCPEWQSAYTRVDEILRRVVRASSAVACVNSVVRMHQARHRHVNQGMLDLKRLYWNCRALRHGKRKGACPYELLGLKLPTSHWWTLLQMDSKELEQKLSTQKVAA
jgi:hypothetical protein